MTDCIEAIVIIVLSILHDGNAGDLLWVAIEETEEVERLDQADYEGH